MLISANRSAGPADVDLAKVGPIHLGLLPYKDIEEALKKSPKLVATRIYDMMRARGYLGSVIPVRRRIAQLRPKFHEPFLHRRLSPGRRCYGELRRKKRRPACMAHFRRVVRTDTRPERQFAVRAGGRTLQTPAR